MSKSVTTRCLRQSRTGRPDYRPQPGNSLNQTVGFSGRSHGLRDEADSFERLLDDISDGIYAVNREMRITFMNAAGKGMCGYPAAELIGCRCDDNLLVHIDASGKRLCHSGCPMKATLSDGKARESFVFLKHRDGHRVPVEVRISALHDEQGERCGAVQVFRSAKERYDLERRARRLEAAVHQDGLTGLGNRRLGQDMLETSLHLSRASKVPAGLLYCDIDHFKRVNDLYGHAVGDRVLKMVARTLRGALRDQDVVVRWGGEEFLCILPGVAEQGLRAVAERARVLTANSYCAVDGQQLSATISIGAATVCQEDTAESWVDRADSALYRAKSLGRDCVVMADEPQERDLPVPERGPTETAGDGKLASAFASKASTGQ
jgi:diguanylate cyclase (GGDEF)-like protein/PAS domain S-box-containing protein